MTVDQLVVLALRGVFLLYVTLVLLHSTLERVYALRSRQRRARPDPAPEPARWPAVDVVIPCFNEEPALLEACCRSVADQDYAGRMQAWLVDDGSRNRDACWRSTSAGPTRAGTCGCWTATPASAPPRTVASGTGTASWSC
jgi:cellulose synthase/poly-beta-1,6-N-acetylglucosamine synthase-like glycosyltransferase